MGAFHHGSSTSSSDSSSSTLAVLSPTCPPIPTPIADGAPIAGSLTFTHLSQYITGIAMAIAMLATFGLILMHATHLSRRNEQVKIMRVISIIPCFAALSFGSTFLNAYAVDLQVWLHVPEAIALASFFQLVCEFLLAEQSGTANGYGQGAGYAEPNGFGQVPAAEAKYDQPVVAINTKPTKRVQIFAFQYLPVASLVAILADVTNATGHYCFNATDIHFASMWLRIIQAISVVLCFISILRFVNRVKKSVPHHRLMVKLLSFKAIVILDFIQTLIFGFAANKFSPTPTLAYTDMTAAIPAIILNLEMVIFSVIFWFNYSFRPYVRKDGAQYSNGFMAIVEAYNPISVLRDLFKTWY